MNGDWARKTKNTGPNASAEPNVQTLNHLRRGARVVGESQRDEKMSEHTYIVYTRHTGWSRTFWNRTQRQGKMIVAHI